MPFSSHLCLGGWDAGVSASGGADLGSVDQPWARLARNQKERTCVFRNVCFDGDGGGAWLYFAREDEFRGARQFRAAVDVWARGDFAHTADVSEDHRFAIRRAPLPPTAEYLSTPTVVKLAALAPANFGHFLGNGLYPAFVAAHRLFGAAAEQTPLQLLLLGANQTDPKAMRARCRRWADEQRRRPAAAAAVSAAISRPPPPRRRVQQQQQQRGGRRMAELSALDGSGSVRCAATARLVAKFAAGLLPGLSDAPLLWEGSLAAAARPRPGKLLCTRRLVVGTGDLGWSTVHRLAAADGGGANRTERSTRRRPPQPLWGEFIEHMLRRLDARGLGGRSSAAAAVRSAGHAAAAASSSAAAAASDAPTRAVLLIKHGRRALAPGAYGPLRAAMAAALKLEVDAFEPAKLPLTAQLERVRKAAVGVTPDGGTSFLLAFLPAGGALLVLGALERWVWANDGRLRAFYCQPKRRDATLPCGHERAAERLAGGAAATAPSDCYAFGAVEPCVAAMLPRAASHARLTWPQLG